MKKLLILLISLAFVAPAFAADKKPVPAPIKKHKKAEATGKVADDKPTKPAKKK
jgi:hypothetical protein